MRTLRLLGVLSLALIVGNCGDDTGGGGPEEGWLRLTLDTPNTGDGAILFRIEGGQIDLVYSGTMVTDVHSDITPSYTRVVLAGNLQDGDVAFIHVPDIADVGDYSVIFEQAAANSPPYAQRSVVGYSIGFTVVEE